MGGQPAAEAERPPGGPAVKKLIGDIRAALEHADDPCFDKLSKCFRHNGADPSECPQCGGDPQYCAELQADSHRPRYPETDYAFFLNSFIEAFHPDPRDLSWRDMEIFNAYQIARNQHERKRLNKQGQD